MHKSVGCVQSLTTHPKHTQIPNTQNKKRNQATQTTTNKQKFLKQQPSNTDNNKQTKLPTRFKYTRVLALYSP